MATESAGPSLLLSLLGSRATCCYHSSMPRSNSAAAPALIPLPVAPRPPVSLWVGIAAASALAVGTMFWVQSPLPPPKLASRTQITGDGLPKTSVLSDGSHLYLSETLEGRHIISRVSMNDSLSSRPGRPFTEGVGYAMAPIAPACCCQGPKHPVTHSGPFAHRRGSAPSSSDRPQRYLGTRWPTHCLCT